MHPSNAKTQQQAAPDTKQTNYNARIQYYQIKKYKTEHESERITMWP
jgi:hypothetical protein